MNPRICVCCGQPMCENDKALWGNPSICASCTSLADGMDDTGVTGVIESDETGQDSSPQVLLFPLAELDARVGRKTGSPGAPGAHN